MREIEVASIRLRMVIANAPARTGRWVRPKSGFAHVDPARGRCRGCRGCPGPMSFDDFRTFSPSGRGGASPSGTRPATMATTIPSKRSRESARTSFLCILGSSTRNAVSGADRRTHGGLVSPSFSNVASNTSYASRRASAASISTSSTLRNWLVGDQHPCAGGEADDDGVGDVAHDVAEPQQPERRAGCTPDIRDNSRIASSAIDARIAIGKDRGQAEHDTMQMTVGRPGDQVVRAAEQVPRSCTGHDRGVEAEHRIGRPAIIAYAIACGTPITATVRPAMASARRLVRK